MTMLQTVAIMQPLTAARVMILFTAAAVQVQSMVETATIQSQMKAQVLRLTAATVMI